MVAFTTVNLGLVAQRTGDFQAGLEYAAAAVDLFRELGDDGGAAVALANCGWNFLDLSDPERAAEVFREALAIMARAGATRTYRALGAALGLAAALVARHEEERGAQLLGAVASLREELGNGFEDEDEQVRHDQAVADAREALGEEAFAAAWARGEAMTPEEIVAFCAAPTDTNDG
jgi:tetratricopeptide (TPR) repeat protein